jgi:hypothetical protein
MMETNEEICLLNIPAEISGVLDDNHDHRPNFVGICVPRHVQQMLGWKNDYELELSVDGGVISIYPKDSEIVLDAEQEGN